MSSAKKPEKHKAAQKGDLRADKREGDGVDAPLDPVAGPADPGQVLAHRMGIPVGGRRKGIGGGDVLRQQGIQPALGPDPDLLFRGQAGAARQHCQSRQDGHTLHPLYQAIFH